MRAGRGWLAGTVVLLAAVVTGGSLLQSQATERVASATLFDLVHRYVAERYVDEVDSDSLYGMAIDGLLVELGDPYAAYIRGADDGTLLSGNYGGVGMRVLAGADGITVLGVLPNSPSEALDLEKLDLIVEVDGESTRGWSQQEAVTALRGERGEPVDVLVERAGRRGPFPVRIVRDQVHLDATESVLLEGDVGYVRLGQFTRSSARELAAAIDGLRERGAGSVIIDLRGNSGGILPEAVEVADLFLDAGSPVVETRGRDLQDNQRFAAPGPDRYPGLPMVVLVNGWSASASEIVAGALQDFDRAVVMGSRTFGKGVMQSVFPLPDRRYLRLTTGTWYTPSGRSIHRERNLEAQFGSNQFNQAVLEAVELGLADAPLESPAAEADTAGRQVFRTAGGRPVYGGGGIQPDLLVHPDTLTTPEQALRAAMFEKQISLADLSLRFAVDWVRANPNARPTGVTPVVRTAFIRFVEDETGGVIDEVMLREGSGLLDYQLGSQLAMVAFDDEAGLKAQIDQHREVADAAAMLRAAATPEQLIALATADRAETAGG